MIFKRFNIQEFLLFAVAILFLVSLQSFGEHTPTAHESIAIYNRHSKNRANIRKSDLLMRVLHNASGPVSKEKAWKDWRATRLEWTYANEPNFVAMIHDNGGTFAGAIASGTNEADRSLVAFAGDNIMAHGRYRGCMNNPGFVAEQQAKLKGWAKLGADFVQHDEALTNFTSFHYGWASCFCDHCMEGFSNYCRDQNVQFPDGVESWDNFHYGDYLKTQLAVTSNGEYQRRRETLPLAVEFERYQAWVGRRYKAEFFKRWRDIRQEPLVLSLNMVAELAGTFGLSYCPILDKLDYLIGEYYIDKKPTHEWLHSARLADAMNMEFIASIKKIAQTPTVEETRRAMAIAYASGRHIMLPWDIYIQAGPRWYSNVEDYQDMIAFIHDHAELLDGYRPYFNLTLLVPFSRPEYESSLVVLSEELSLRGIPYAYALCGYDRNNFVSIPIYPNDFKTIVPVWLAGVESDLAASDRAVLDRLIHQGQVRYQGQLMPELFALKGQVITQVQALHDMDTDDADQDDSDTEPRDSSALSQALARTAVDRIIRSGIKPVYKVSDFRQVLVFPRIPPTANAPIVVHVVNTGAERTHERIWLEGQLFAPGVPISAKVHRPGQDAIAVQLRSEAGGWSLAIPTLKEWAIVALDVAERSPVPSANDVVVRTLEFREVDSGSEMDPFQAIRDFHVTRLEWTYIDFDARNRECVERVQAMGVLFGGAGSASLHGGIRHFPPQPLDIHMLDLDGKMVVQPHMRGWTDKRGIGDPSSPAFYEHHLNYYKKVVDWGAQLLHRDEPESPVFAAQRYGGGFSPSGIAGFRDWLRRNLSAEQRVMLGIEDVATFDYAEYLRERGAPAGDVFAAFDDPIKPYWVRYWADTTTAFWERLIADIKTYAHPRVLSFSGNNSSLQMWESYHRTFDYANSELLIETAHPVHLWERTQAALAFGKVQVFGAPKTRAQPVSEAAKNALLRKVYATAYACGMLAKVPWDVFDQSPDGHARYFAKPEDMADLCAFVRAGDWQEYREIAALGPGLPPKEPSVLRIEGGNGGVYAFWRKSKTPDRPMLVHLVDWGLPKTSPPAVRDFTSPSGNRIGMYHASETIERTAAEPFRLVIPHAAWPTLAEATFTLLRPAAYDATAHAEVLKLGDYDRLVNRTLLNPIINETEIEMELPPLTPWGILEIKNGNLHERK